MNNQIISNSTNTIPIPELIQQCVHRNQMPQGSLFYGHYPHFLEQVMIKTAALIHNIQPPNIQPNDQLQEPAIDILCLITNQRFIKIDIIKQLQQRMTHGSSHAPYLIIMIHEINKLTVSAANALLKSIEEPPENVLFLFTAQNKHQCLPTILSRCQHVFIPTNPDDLTQLNEQLSNELIEKNLLIDPIDFIHQSYFNQCITIQKLPSSIDDLGTLLCYWEILLYGQINALDKKSFYFLQKIIEIKSKLSYNLNLKLHLMSIVLEYKGG